MTHRETILYAVLGFGVWLSGAVMFRLGGRLMFESGPWVLLFSAIGIAVSVCLLLRTTMAWRKAPLHQSVWIAVIMALPGLYGDVAYVLNFSAITGLQPTSVGPFAALVVFGNAVLLSYALVRSQPKTVNP